MNEFLKSPDNLHQEGIVEEELIRRMASKWEKAVADLGIDKGELIRLGALVCHHIFTRDAHFRAKTCPFT